MIDAKLVKELREVTGAGMMDCKKALTEVGGDLQKAIEYLKEKGITKAAKKSSRIAAEGLVDVYVTEDNKIASVIEVNAETDFVAKNEEFKKFVKELAKLVALKDPKSVYPATIIGGIVGAIIALFVFVSYNRCASA